METWESNPRCPEKILIFWQRLLFTNLRFIIPFLAERLEFFYHKAHLQNLRTVEVEQDVTVEQVNDAMRAAASGPLKNILSYCMDSIVSTDIIGDSHSSIFDSQLTQVMQKRMVKVISWYDNEWGYSTRMEELIGRLAALDGMTPDYH